jgi:predicted nucleic acid-binding protein
MKHIADTGLLLAALDRRDPCHEWGRREFSTHAPFATCEAVMDELGFLTGDARIGLRLLARGDLVLDFDLSAHVARVLELLDKYSDREMDLADACLVRMSELADACLVWTADREDFRVYRRHGRQVVPCVFPD